MKLSNLGKGALVGLGLSCGVASTPLTRMNTSHNETSLLPERNFTRENVIEPPFVKREDICLKVNDYSRCYSGDPLPLIGGIVGAVVATTATCTGILCCCLHKKRKATRDNVPNDSSDIVLNIGESINSNQGNNDTREVDIVERSTTRDTNGTTATILNDINSAIQFSVAPPSYEDVVGLQTNQENNGTREADITMSDRKDIRELEMSSTSYENIVRSQSNIENNSNREEDIVRSQSNIEDNSNKEQNVTINNRHSTRVLPFVSIQCPPNGSFRHNTRPLPTNRNSDVTRNDSINIKGKKPIDN